MLLSELVNLIKSGLQKSIGSRKNQLQEAEINQQLSSEQIDVTLPGRRHGI